MKTFFTKYILAFCIIVTTVLLAASDTKEPITYDLDRDIERADSLFRTGWVIEAAELSRYCKTQLSSEKNSLRYAKNLLTEAWCASYLNDANAFALAEEVFELYDKILVPKDEMLYADASHLYWWEYAWATKDYNSSNIKLNELLQVYRDKPLELSEVYRTISRLHRAQKDFSKAFHHIELAEKTVPKGMSGAKYQLAKIYNSCSMQYSEVGNDSLSADYTQRAWDLFKKEMPGNTFWLEQLADRMLLYNAFYHLKNWDLKQATHCYLEISPFFEKRQPADLNLSHIYASLELLLDLQGYPFAAKLYGEKARRFADAHKNQLSEAVPNDTKFGIRFTALNNAAASGNQNEVIAQGKLLLADLRDSTQGHHIYIKAGTCQLMVAAHQKLNDTSAVKYYTDLAVEIVKDTPLYGDYLMSWALDAAHKYEWRRSIELNRKAVAVYQKAGEPLLKLVSPLANMAISYNLEQQTNGVFDLKSGKDKFLSVFDSLCYYSNQVVSAAIASPSSIHAAFQGYADLGRFHWMHYLHTGDVNSLYAAKSALDSAKVVMELNRQFNLSGIFEIGNSKINLVSAFNAQDLNAQVNLKLYELDQTKSEYLDRAFILSEFNRSINLRTKLILNRLSDEFNFSPELNKYFDYLVEEKTNLPILNQLQLDTLIMGFEEFHSLEYGTSEQSLAYQNTKYSTALLGIRQVQERLLDHNQTFVEYGKTMDDRWYAYVIGKNSYKVIYLHQESDSIVNRLIGDFLALRHNNETRTVPDDRKAENIRKFQEAAQKLHQLFIKPIQNSLSERVIVAAVGNLNSIPFDLFMSGAPKISGKYSKEDPYLLRQYAFSYVYSAQILDLMRENTNRNKSTTRDVFTAFVPYFDSQEGQLPSGPFTAKACSDLFRGRYYENKDASAAAFQTITAARASQILLLYQHGYANISTLDSAYLQFTKIEGQDNTLSNQDIYKMRVRSDLVFLAACMGAQGKTDGLEGIVSIARALTYAGAGSVIASQWKMEDNTARKFIPAFFQKTKNPNTPKDVALAETKRDILRQPTGNPDPWYFGSFVLYGDSRALF